MSPPQLYMFLLGCKPEGRHTEQHDVFFCISHSLNECIPHIQQFWPNGGKIHVDAWRLITKVQDYRIEVTERGEQREGPALFFLNLGGYKKEEFEEFHYKLLVVSHSKADAIQQAKETAFYKHTGFEGAVSHIDDKYGIDVDDIYELEDILPDEMKQKYQLKITPVTNSQEDEWDLGYLPLSKII